MPDAPPQVVTLVPLGQDAWEAWRERSVREYAAAKVSAGAWTPDVAMGRAADELAQLLPEGPATPGNELRSVVDADGRIVGSVWVGPRGPDDTATCFVWDIHIDDAVRGRGYGRAAMLEVAALARRMGCSRIELHVFSENHVARGLYRSLGYVETDVQMRLDLS